MKTRVKGSVVTALAVASCAIIPSGANAAGYSSFFKAVGGCYVEGITKTYYEGGSSSTSVAVRGRLYRSYNFGSTWSQIAGPTENFASGSGGGEARVSWVQGVGSSPVRVEGRHWGTPFGSANYLTAENSPILGCG